VEITVKLSVFVKQDYKD